MSACSKRHVARRVSRLPRLLLRTPARRNAYTLDCNTLDRRTPMSQLEYLIALISIIVGLGLTELARSLRELVRPSRRVRWHWLPLLWAATLFLLILQVWWSSFRVLQQEVFQSALAFLPYALLFVGLYLLCAFALPDEDWTGYASDADASTEEALDLESFYFSAAHRHWFFGTHIALLIFGQFVSAMVMISRGSASLWPFAKSVGLNLGFAAVLGVLLVSERRSLHATVALLSFGMVLYSLAALISPIG